MALGLGRLFGVLSKVICNEEASEISRRILACWAHGHSSSGGNVSCVIKALMKCL